MAAARLHPGLELDGFALQELAHTGGMARLWIVTHPGHEQPLLMKVPMIGEGDDPAAIVSFEMEQMILPRLTGPHVPQHIANGDFATHPYIVMERLPGKSLYPILKELPLAPRAVAELGVKIATAVDALHRQHVVHLDLKPSNILFRDSGEAVLIDYGLARHNLLPDLMEEEFRLPYGTAPYMAPEQILRCRSDYRSDIFAMGVLLYFFATGERPFGDPQRLKGLKRRLWRDPWPPRALKPAIPPRAAGGHPPGARGQPGPPLSDGCPDGGGPEGSFCRDTVVASPQGEARSLYRGDQAAVQSRAAGAAAGPAAAGPAFERAHRRRRHRSRRQFRRPDGGAARDDAEDHREEPAGPCRLHQHSEDQPPGTRYDAGCGQNKHVQRLVELKNWAAPLDAPEGVVTFHVLEAVSPADAILDYARQNYVDHLVMGARAASTMRSLLGSVSGEVAAHAPCTVTVVRKREAPGN